ncbi:tRNA dihydrouridine synthase DusB [Elusimicrobiota bacterium]
MFKIGNITIKSKAMLSPMAGVTDLPYRLINRSFGCEFAFTEMISARSLHNGLHKTRLKLSCDKDDRPLGIQLLGWDTKYLLSAQSCLEDHPYDILDINAACPARKVISGGGGAALMKEPGKIYNLIKALVKNTDRPVTLKIRTGWSSDSINAPEVALRAQDAGAKAVFIHGRTKEQGYSGEVDYDTISKVKRSLDIPVIGSGDIFNPQQAKKMLDTTSCDGILVARGSYGNPWIFSHIDSYLEKGELPDLPQAEKVADIILLHLDRVMDLYGEKQGILIYRKVFVFYTKSFCGIKQLRRRVFHITQVEDLKEIIKEFRDTAQRNTVQCQ